jgi:hypothetical protein
VKWSQDFSHQETFKTILTRFCPAWYQFCRLPKALRPCVNAVEFMSRTALIVISETSAPNVTLHLELAKTS